MKNKTIWIVVGLIILLIVAYFIYKKMNTTTFTINTSTTTGLTKRTFAPLPGSQSDYSAIDAATGQPVWLHRGLLFCPAGYTKATRIEDTGWCKII